MPGTQVDTYTGRTEADRGSVVEIKIFSTVRATQTTSRKIINQTLTKHAATKN